VTYVVTGTAQAAMLTYSNGIGGIQQETATLPWKRSLSAQQGGSLSISAQNAGRFGDITVSIVIDGVMFTGSNSSGAYAVATAHGACCP
jgi:hypothetical protein